MSFLTSTLVASVTSATRRKAAARLLGAAPWLRLGDACRSEGGPLFSSHSLSTASSSESRTPVESSKAQSDVYVGPFGGALKRVKILSVSSLVATTSSLPVMVYMQGSAQFSGRIGAVMTVGFFSLFTTSMLHWFSSPYICRLTTFQGKEEVEVETCSLLGRKKHRKFALGDVRAPEGSLRPLITFEVDGQPFYVDEKHLTENGPPGMKVFVDKVYELTSPEETAQSEPSSAEQDWQRDQSK